MVKVYPVIFTEDEDFVLIEVPDFEIFTQAEDLTEAVSMAREAIGLKGISLEDNGEEIPEASKVGATDITKSEFYEEGNTFSTLVDVDFAEFRKKCDNKMVRRNVTLPNWLNVAAEKEHLNVSKVLQDALKEKLQLV